MTKDEALDLALEKVANALPAYIEGTPAREYLAVIHSALAAPVQEPVNLHQALTDPENQPNQYGVEFGMHGEKMMFKVGVQQFALDYEPDTQDEFNFMRDMLIHAFSTFTQGVKTTPPAAPVQEPDELTIAYMDGYDKGKAAAQRQWVGLSEEEIDKLKHLIDWTATWSHGRFAYEIEQLLKEKNA